MLLLEHLRQEWRWCWRPSGSTASMSSGAALQQRTPDAKHPHGALGAESRCRVLRLWMSQGRKLAGSGVVVLGLAMAWGLDPFDRKLALGVKAADPTIVWAGGGEDWPGSPWLPLTSRHAARLQSIH